MPEETMGRAILQLCMLVVGSVLGTSYKSRNQLIIFFTVFLLVCVWVGDVFSMITLTFGTLITSSLRRRIRKRIVQKKEGQYTL